MPETCARPIGEKRGHRQYGDFVHDKSRLGKGCLLKEKELPYSKKYRDVFANNDRRLGTLDRKQAQLIRSVHQGVGSVHVSCRGA